MLVLEKGSEAVTHSSIQVATVDINETPRTMEGAIKELDLLGITNHYITRVLQCYDLAGRFDPRTPCLKKKADFNKRVMSLMEEDSNPGAVVKYSLS